MSRPAKPLKGVERWIIVEGQQVHVTFDAGTGKVLAVSTSYWLGNDQAERIAKLAIALIQRDIAAARPAASNKRRTKISAETRRKDAETHWSHDWLEGAYSPELGAGRLAQAARAQCALNRPNITAKKRDEITEYRARQFLKKKAKT